MRRKVPPSLYSPALPYQIETQLRRGEIPGAFVRRMRVINCLSAITLMKFEETLMSPFDVIDLHHILDKQISQDAIIDQLDSDEMSYACLTGNVGLLWDIAPGYPLLERGYYSGWIHKFFVEPFDPLCVMLAMRAKAMLDLVDDEGHSYNLIRKLGFGFIDFGEIPGEEPGDPGDYYPPDIDNPIDCPDIPVPPGPGEPGYVPGPGEPGYVPPGPGEPGYVPPLPGEPGYFPPPDGEHMTPGSGTVTGPAHVSPDGFFTGRVGSVGAISGGGLWDCCRGTEEDYVTIGYEGLSMLTGATQMLTVEGSKDFCDDDNYTWEITAGTGELLTDVGKATFYTAPDTNPDCADNPTIALICKEFTVDSIQIVIEACAPDVSIGYTTQQMAVNEVQDLTADIVGGECGIPIYTWEIVSGGGTLDKVAGEEVKYTAPATNPDCDSNPVIALFCNGVLVDNLAIAINAYPSGNITDRAIVVASGECEYGGLCEDAPYESPGCPRGTPGPCPSWDPGGYCGVWKWYFFCNGTQYNFGSSAWCAKNTSPPEGGCENKTSGCVDCGTINGIVAACSGITDVRSADMKANGCCPVQLL